MPIGDKNFHRDNSIIYNFFSTSLSFGLSTILIVRRYFLKSMTKEIKKEKLYYINDFPDPHDDCTLDGNEFEDQNKPEPSTDL